ncbi:MAG TPA: hypothetical protein VI320_33405 [Terracidiphilus sp.]|jgi:hypothetical protein
MATLFEKLQLRDHPEILILNAPESFKSELSRMPVENIHRSLEALAEIHFLLAFVTKQAEVDALVPKIAARAKGDATVWFAYPKGTSKKFKCDFNRDTGWALLKDAGFDTVRSIAIDEDWTGLRFRRTQFIKSR